MKINISVCARIFTVIFLLGGFINCAEPPISSLQLRLDNSLAAQKNFGILADSAGSAFIPLNALNKGAQRAKIENPEKSAYLYFGFPKNFSTVYRIALELQFSNVSKNVPQGDFFIALLYDDDFTPSGKLKNKLAKEPLVYGKLPAAKSLRLSFVLPKENVRGFVIHSSAELSVDRADLTAPRYGWAKPPDATPWIGFSDLGGLVPPELFAPKGSNPLMMDFSHSVWERQSSDASFHNIYSLKVLLRDNPLDMGSPAEQNAVICYVNDRLISIQRAPAQSAVSFDSALFNNIFSAVRLEKNSHMIEGVILEGGKRSVFAPIPADTGLILDWPQKEWRRRDFELFLWEQFPSVLIFDFNDYKTQDKFLKRLAFFVEKNGYIGHLLKNQEIAALHGFNAHDYKAENLAAFFNKAQKESFSLNTEELLLKEILLQNGIIILVEDEIKAGEGAFVSLSRESPTSLRSLFITHECLHGIFFTQAAFREKVINIYNASDPQSIRFLRRYFEVTPSLNYNTNDDYLMVNEFMAYTLQQALPAVSSYFADKLAARTYIGRAEPALCEHIQNTRAAAFVQAAQNMSDFLYKNWGITGGRVSLVHIN